MEKTSIERCESSLNNLILPALGHMKMAKIQPLHIQGFYDDLLEKGYTANGRHKEYKPNTIKRIHQTQEIQSKSSTTMDIYSHALKKMDEKAADALGSLLSKKA